MIHYRVLVIDDERLAREEVKQHLAAYPDMALVGEAAHADQAAALITTLQPDLIFLDIHMPEQSGFDLLQSLDVVPLVVFTTAYDQYAVKAFEWDALDYLVKPIRTERFQQAIEKVRNKLSTQLANHSLFIKEGDHYHFVRIGEIHLMESAGNYVCLHAGNRKYYLKRSLNQMEKSLETSGFFRISRTELVNTNFIRQLQAMEKGKVKLLLQNGRWLEASGRQSALLKNKLGTLPG